MKEKITLRHVEAAWWRYLAAAVPAAIAVLLFWQAITFRACG
jgi:hypothetical protein